MYISIENNTYWGGDFTGTLASGWYDLCAEDTMMTIVLKALALDGYSWWGTGASDTGGYDITYLSGIYMDKNGNGRRDNSEPSLAEFDVPGVPAGWAPSTTGLSTKVSSPSGSEAAAPTSWQTATT